MTDTRPYLQHLSGSGDLETPHEEIRAGFLSLALEKNRQAIPFVEEARALKVTASQAKTPAELLQIGGIEPALLTAASLSNKAMGHLRPEDKRNILREWIKEVLEPEGNDFVDELVYRFLLTRGDALGGMMRNLAGVLGGGMNYSHSDSINPHSARNSLKVRPPCRAFCRS